MPLRAFFSRILYRSLHYTYSEACAQSFCKTCEYSLIKYHPVQQAGVDDQVVEGILA